MVEIKSTSHLWRLHLVGLPDILLVLPERIIDGMEGRVQLLDAVVLIQVLNAELSISH